MPKAARQLIALFILFILFVLIAPTGARAQLSSEMLSGLELRNIGPANMSGRFVDIAVVESDPYIYYAASATGGVFKTTNNGVTFEPVFENEATHSVGDIAVHQKRPDIVWVGTGERANRQSSSWGRRRLQIDRRRRDVDEHGPSRNAPHRAHRSPPRKHGRRLRRRHGPPVGEQRRARAIQVHRWWEAPGDARSISMT